MHIYHMDEGLDKFVGERRRLESCQGERRRKRIARAINSKRICVPPMYICILAFRVAACWRGTKPRATAVFAGLYQSSPCRFRLESFLDFWKFFIFFLRLASAFCLDRFWSNQYGQDGQKGQSYLQLSNALLLVGAGGPRHVLVHARHDDGVQTAKGLGVVVGLFAAAVGLEDDLAVFGQVARVFAHFAEDVVRQECARHLGIQIQVQRRFGR